MTMEDVIEEALVDLTTELKEDTDFNSDILKVKIKNVYREIVSRRKYENSSMNGKDNKIAEDIYRNYYHNLVNTSRYDYNQIGVEGQSAHTENGVTGQYTDRNKFLGDIVSFVKIL